MDETYDRFADTYNDLTEKLEANGDDEKLKQMINDVIALVKGGYDISV